MPSVRVLARADVARLLPGLHEQVDLVENTYVAVANGEVELPPKPGIHPRDDAFIHAMPAYLRGQDVAAMKWVSGYPGNAARGLPYISGVIIVNDPATGVPLAFMDAAEITAARTAAASGACIRRWAPEGWRTAAVLGVGEQGRYHLGILRALNPSAEIRVFDPNPAQYARVEGVEPAPSARAAVETAQVIVTAGPILDQPDPPLSRDWLGDGYLLLPLDFDSYAQASCVRSTDWFVVDDVPQFDYYREHGVFADWPRPRGSVGEALREGWGGTRIACVNLGIGALDAAFAAAALRAAEQAGSGTLVDV
jgi:alanine dehydrogenase